MAEESHFMEPIVSITVPCYNVQDYIDCCMDSLVSQTIGVEKLEIILVNDASTDATYDRLLAWEQRFPDSVLVINCIENHRQGAARNLGVSYARGTYLAFVDTDDWVEPDMCEVTTEKADAYQADMVIFNYDRPGADGLCQFSPDTENEFIEIKTLEDRKALILKRREYTMACLQICNRRWYLAHGIVFPENLLYEDHVIFLLYCFADRIYISEKRLYHWFNNKNSTMGTNKNPLDRIFVQILLYTRLCESPPNI